MLVWKHRQRRRKRKPLLVGENNPYSADPKYALFPLPKGSAGHRLATEIMGLSVRDYLRMFERVNLCDDQRWSMKKARKRSGELTDPLLGYTTIVLFGKKVCTAFNIAFEPFTEKLDPHGPNRLLFLVLPHPSGRSQLWNGEGTYERARKLLRKAGIEV